MTDLSKLFNNKYDRVAYLGFLSTLLPDDFSSRNESLPIPEMDHIKSVNLMGECPSLELKVYEAIHNSENDPRVGISREIFRLLAGYGVSKALVLFTSQNSDNYRFSYVSMQLELEGAKVKKTYTNPRRFSYFLGPEAKIGTPARQLKGRLQNLMDLEKAFSLEVVNKEFYEEIARLFSKLVGGERKIGSKNEKFRIGLKLPGNPDNHQKYQEFAVRLIGRLIFCWFLKKKKSPTGPSLIPDEILFQEAVRGNYYHEVLENLFFQVLNTPQDERDSRFKAKPWSDIPFLNGGLFEPHEDDHYLFDELTGISKAVNTLKINDEWFKEILRLFETYNFTIDENTAVDVDLSIDPEMLGRIFENLLAEINPETGETARKSTGSFYTPRVVVDYMVDEGLKVYLRNKTGIEENLLARLLSYDDTEVQKEVVATERTALLRALESVKVMDPACGSGAFPMGMLQKMLTILQKIDPISKFWLESQLDWIGDRQLKLDLMEKLKDENFNYIHKIGIIRKSLYGVDIQPIAVEIAKLRCFLTLVVDENVDDRKSNRGVKSLPNLEFKFISANTLIKLGGSGLNLVEATDEIKELKQIRDQYFSEQGRAKKQTIERFKKAQGQITKGMFAGRSVDPLALKLSNWKPFSDEAADWFDPDWMFGETDGFDIVIGNPPYVRQEKLKKDKEKFKEFYECYTGISDIYVYFYERSIELLKPGGVLCFISSNKYFRSGYGEKLRRYLASRTNIKSLIDFGDAPVFTAIAYPSIIVTQKGEPEKGEARVMTWETGLEIEKFPDVFARNSFQLKQEKLRPEGWAFESPEALMLLDKLRKAGKPLGEYVKGRFYYGIKTGFNEAFVVDRLTRDQLIKEHKSSAEVLKPFLRGKDVKRWIVNFEEQYLIRIESSENKNHPWSDSNLKEAETIFKRTYPAIYAFMMKSRKKLIDREDQGKYFWELRSCAYYKEFEEPKIIYPDITKASSFAYDEEKMYLVNTLYLMPTSEKWLLGLLNSRTVLWFYKRTSSQIRGGFVRYIAQYVEKIPVPSKPNIKEIEKNVNRLLSSDNDGKTNFEGNINRLIYEAFSLNPSEIEMIEDDTKEDFSN